MKSQYLNLIRVAFVLICCITGWLISLGFGVTASWLGTISGIIIGLIIIAIDNMLENFSFKAFSSGTFGLMIGMLCAWLLTNIDFFNNINIADKKLYEQIFKLLVYYFFGFIGMSLALRANREEFSLLIPYVRFKREATHDQITIIDNEIIIDGRITGLVDSGFLGGEFIIPRSEVDDLQHLANNKDPIKKAKGTQGLENLERLIKDKTLTLTIHEKSDEKSSREEKFIQLAETFGAKILTNDEKLTSLAHTKDITTLSLNTLIKALQPVVKTGDVIELRIVKKGKEDDQGIGFLHDGTMIVVNNAIDKLGTVQEVVVGGNVQTSAGRLVFADLSSDIREANAQKPKRKINESEGEKIMKELGEN